MLFLRQDPTIRDFQNYVHELEIERGFIGDGLERKCLLLTEEMGEFFDLIDKPAQHGLIAGELADILIYLCSIANRLAYNGAEAFVGATGISLLQWQQDLGVQTMSLEARGLQLGVALGKLCKVVRKFEGGKMGTHSIEIKQQAVLLDAFIALCAAANSAGVNLEQAFRDKEEINKTRTWVSKIEARV